MNNSNAASLFAGAALLVACQTHNSTTTVSSPGENVPQYDIATFSKTVSVGGTSVSPDGTKLLLTSNETGVFNVYSQPLSGGAKVQLTRSKTDAITGITWLDDASFLYTKDKGGNERNHIYLQRVGEGEPVDLTPGDEVKARMAGLSKDRRSFIAFTNERDARYYDAYEYRLATTTAEASTPPRSFERELVFENKTGLGPGSVSRDLRYFAFTKTNDNRDNDLYLWDRHSPETPPKHITPHEGKISHDLAAFSPDGARLYYVSDKGSEFKRAWSYDLATGEHAAVASYAWDIMNVSFTRCGRYRTMTINEDATPRLVVHEVATGAEVTLPKIPGMTIGQLQTSRDGSRVIAYAGGPTSVGDLYVGANVTGPLERKTHSMPEEIDEAHLVAAEVVRYPSFDGLSIPAILYRPHVASRDTPAPALVWVHGGPGGQSRTSYRATIQYLVNHGYGILMVNNRGSSGYGKTFFHLDDKRHGEDDLKDCIWGRRYLESLDWVDDARVGIIGGSYGGYMVAAALAFEPDAFEVGVDIFGVTNWLRTLENIPAWWESFREMLYAEMGDPATDRERLRRISPLFHAKNIKKPLLVVQGANDPRVLKVESDEIVAAVRANGVPCEYLVFDDEGHGFRNQKNAMASDRKIVEFLNLHLREQ